MLRFQKGFPDPSGQLLVGAGQSFVHCEALPLVVILPNGLKVVEFLLQSLDRNHQERVRQFVVVGQPVQSGDIGTYGPHGRQETLALQADELANEFE